MRYKVYHVARASVSRGVNFGSCVRCDRMKTLNQWHVEDDSSELSYHQKSDAESNKESNNPDGDVPRERWGSRAEFLLSCIGMSVGIGNIWRFPYLAYKNGGAAFLFPYTILLILVGKPIYFLELAIGQFCSRSSIAVWKCCPIGKGIGWAMQIVCFIVCIYYNVIVAYTIFYTAASFTSTLPWDKCDEWWGANDQCYVRKHEVLPLCKELRAKNSTNVTAGGTCIDSNITRQTASEQYWTRYVLHLHESPGLHDLGGIRWDLALCLLLAWIIVFICLIKGIKSSGKVVYFTATFPYIILLVLLIRGVTLEGAVLGLKYLFIPKWEKLLELNVWKDAAEQMFFSLGISWGILIMFGSYNNFRQKTHIDAIFISTTDFLTSLLGCVAIFSVLGYLATQLSVDIEDVAAKGPGLAFIIYPEALALLPVAPLWSILFFFMLFTLGLDSEFATLEAVLSNIFDEWTRLKPYKTYVVLAACVISFFLGLPCVTSGGQYVFNLMDSYAAGASLMFIGFCEMAVFSWIYGIKRLIHDVQFMLQIKLSPFWLVSWAGICPIFLAIFFVISCVYYTPSSYGSYDYPVWGEVLGFLLEFISIIQIPIWGLAILYTHWKKGNISDAIRPTSTWGPEDAQNRRDWLDSANLLQPSQASSLDRGIDNPAPVSLSTINLASSDKLQYNSRF